MTASASHWDVGAYVLGALTPADVTAFEEHLVGCDVCADEVEFLLPTAGLLAGIDPGEAIIAHASRPATRDEPATARAGREFDELPGWAPWQPHGAGRPLRPRIGAARTALRRAVPRDLVRRAMAGPSALHRRTRPVPRHGHLGGPTPARRNTIVASLAMALVAAVAFAAGSQFSGGGAAVADGGSNPPATGPHVAAGPTATAAPSTSALMPPSQQLEATDAVSGVHATLAVTGTSWGSQVELTIGGVRGPLWCELVATDSDGKSIVVASWTVHSPGYGIPEDPELLTIQAATAVTLAGTDHFDIHAIAANGAESTLVTLPV